MENLYAAVFDFPTSYTSAPQRGGGILRRHSKHVGQVVEPVYNVSERPQSEV